MMDTIWSSDFRVIYVHFVMFCSLANLIRINWFFTPVLLLNNTIYAQWERRKKNNRSSLIFFFCLPNNLRQLLNIDKSMMLNLMFSLSIGSMHLVTEQPLYLLALKFDIESQLYPLCGPKGPILPRWLKQ